MKTLRAVLAWVALAVASASSAEKPNMTFMLADDLGWGDLGSAAPGRFAAGSAGITKAAYRCRSSCAGPAKAECRGREGSERIAISHEWWGMGGFIGV